MPLYTHYEGLLRGDACDVVVQLLSESEPPGAARTLALTRRVELAYGDGSSVEALCESSVEIEATDDWSGTLADWITNLGDENEGVMRLSWTDPATGADCVWSGGIAPGTLYDVALYPEIKRRALRVSAACGLRRLGDGAAAWQAGGGATPTMRTLPELLAPLLAAVEPPEAARTVDYAVAVQPSGWRALGDAGTSGHWLLDTRFRPSGADEQGTPARDAATGLLGALGLRVWLGLDERWHVDSWASEGVASEEGMPLASVLRIVEGDPDITSRSYSEFAPAASAIRADATVSRSAPAGTVDVSLAPGGTQLQLVRDRTLATWASGLPVLYEVQLQGDSTIAQVSGPSGDAAARLTGDAFNNLPATLRSVLCRVKEGEGLRLRCSLEHRAASTNSAFSWRLRIVPDDPSASTWSGKPGIGWVEGDVWLRTNAYTSAWNVPVGDVAGPVPLSGQLVYEVMVEGSDYPVDVARLSALVGSWREGEVVPTLPTLPTINLPRAIGGTVGTGKGREVKASIPTHEFADDWGPLTTTLNGWTTGETGWRDGEGIERWSLQNLAGTRLGIKRRAEILVDGLCVPGVRVLLPVPGAGDVAFIVASCRVDLARYTTKAILVTP